MVIFYNFSKGGRYLIVSEVLSWKGFWKVLTLNINSLGSCLILHKLSRKKHVGTQYEYISFTNRADHHPTPTYAFSIAETIDSNSSLEIKYANRKAWANPFVTITASKGFTTRNNSTGYLYVQYWGHDTYGGGTDLNGCTLKYLKNSLYINGTLKGTDSTSASGTSEGLNIANSSYGDNADAIDIYYIKIWQGDTLSRHFVPCLDLSNNKGMYDIIKKSMFVSGRTCSLNGTSSDLDV